MMITLLKLYFHINFWPCMLHFFCTGIHPRKLWHSRSPFWTSPPCTTAQRTSRESSPEGQWNNQRLSGRFFVSCNFLKIFNDFCFPHLTCYTPSSSVKNQKIGVVLVSHLSTFQAVWILWADWLCSGNGAWRGPRTHDEFEEQSAARFGKMLVDSRWDLRLKAALVLGSCCFIAG